MLRAIFIVLILSVAALSACKQADSHFNPYNGSNMNGS
jgi:hypothetical protein